MRETVVILSMVYKDFLCTPEEKVQLQQEYHQEIEKYEEELKEKYNANNIFQNNQENIKKNNEK